MSCTTWNDRLTERLYGEITPEDDVALAEHLQSCERCVATLEDFTRVRGLLREDERTLRRVPRVLVLRDRSPVRPALLAASLLVAAILAGAGAGAGYALGRGRLPAPVDPSIAVPAVATEDLVRREVDRRLAAWQATHQGPADRKPSLRSDNAAALRGEFAKFERRVNGARAADMDYVLDQIAASEMRVGDRIGKTNQALRTVALASNPRVNEQ